MPKRTYNPLTVEYVIKTHAFIIAESGGLTPIVADTGKLESVLYHMGDDRFYPEFLDKLCHLLFSLNKNHAFNDGNKRTSIAASAFFLEINGHDFALPLFQTGMEEPAVWLASNLIERETLKDIIHFLLYGDESHVLYFIEQARSFRIYIDPHEARLSGIELPNNQSLIPQDLLTQMVKEWLSVEMELSDETKLRLLEAIPAEMLAGKEDDA